MEEPKTRKINNDDIILLLLARTYQKLSMSSKYYLENGLNSFDLSISKNKADYILNLNKIAYVTDGIVRGCDSLYQVMTMLKTSTTQVRKSSLRDKWISLTPREKESFDYSLNERLRQIYVAKKIPITDKSLIMSEKNVISKLVIAEKFLESNEIRTLINGQTKDKDSQQLVLPDLDFLFRFSNATIKMFVEEYVYAGKYNEINNRDVGPDIFQKYMDLYYQEEERQNKIMTSYSVSQMQL